MKKIAGICMVAFMVSMFAIESSYSNDAIPITAEQAFDAYANQEDPVNGNPANVAIIDVRTKGEFYWGGTCAQVNKMLTKNGQIGRASCRERV